LTDDPTIAALATPPAAPTALEAGAGAIECKGIRPTGDFPKDLAGLSPEQIARYYSAMRNSHASLARARGQLQRRSRELREARDRFLTTLHGYEQRLAEIGQEKAEALALAQDLHRELEAFETKQASLDHLLSDLEDAKEQAGFWSILRITELIDRMRSLLRGGH
jgi:chromosome segregation ATPase